MSRKIILVHGFGANPKIYWFPWLIEELESRGHTVIAPTLTKPFHPTAEEWIVEITAAIGEITSDTVIVAHSLGNSAVLRILQNAPAEQRARALISVSPLVLERYDLLFPTFFEEAIDATKIRAHVDSITVLHDPADHWAPFSNAKFLQQACGAKLIECPGQHHFNSLLPGKPIPELLDAVLAVL